MTVSPPASVNPVLTTSYAVLEHTTDVRVSQAGVSSLARFLVQEKESIVPPSANWAEEALHPMPGLRTVKETTDWLFLVSLLNFSFWSDEFQTPEQGRFAIRWKDGVDRKGKGKEVDWTGYWSLPAAINRALDEGIPITSPEYWVRATDQDFAHVFRPSPLSKESMPLFEARCRLMRETGRILVKEHGGSFHNILQRHSPGYDALDIVRTVVDTFPAFRDESIHPKVGKVHLWKRPQILVAELWAAFSSCPETYPQIRNVSALTMFADYRVPQILHDLGLLTYSTYLKGILEGREELESGSELEICIRASSVVAVEELCKAVRSLLEEAGRDEEATRINPVLLDFWLWNRAKELEAEGKAKSECHRTRSIWY